MHRRALLLLALFCSFAVAGAAEEKLRMARFGTVYLYRSTPHPAHVVLFVSGNAGWNADAESQAQAISRRADALVVGIDGVHYMRDLTLSRAKCVYPAADFEALSKVAQKSLEYPNYVTPMIVGYQSGATLVYGTLVQAPPGTFSGAISIGFCPELSMPKLMCKGYGLQSTRLPSGGRRYLPASDLKNPWVVLQGASDSVCGYRDVEAFVKKVQLGDILPVPAMGHVITAQADWMTVFEKAFSGMVKTRETEKKSVAPPVALGDLPLVELPARDGKTNFFAVIISGDGGWASIDRQIGESLVARGVSVVGLNSLQYFWKHRDQQEMSADLARILRHYLQVSQKSGAVLVGYSLGADVLPFMVSGLPADVRAKVIEIALLGPATSVDFEFHLTDWLGSISHGSDRPILPEAEKLKGMKIACFYGEEEEDSLCTHIAHFATPVVLKGGHHFEGNYGPIVDRILQEAGR